MIPALVASTSAVIVYAIAAAIAYTALAAIVCAAIFAIGDGDPVADVQHYRELTESAHRLIPPGPAFSDPEGETSAAIGRFLAEKEEARQALWASSRSRTRGTVDEDRDHEPDAQVIGRDCRHPGRDPRARVAWAELLPVPGRTDSVRSSG
jgi:hypothetical protein